MALENIDAIEESFGLEKGKLAEMITSEENHTIDLDSFIIKPKSDYDSLLSNIKRDSNEIGRKELFKALGVDFEGTGAHKDVKKSVEFLKKWNGDLVNTAIEEAKIDPNKKYDTLNEDFKKVQANLSQWEEKYNTLESTYKQKEQMSTINNTLLKEIPDNTTIDKEDILAILKAKYKFNISEDGFEIIGNDGKALKNQSNMNLTTANEFMKEFITPYLKTVEGGTGAGDSKGGGKETSLELFNKQMNAKNINIGSEVYNEQLSLAIKNGTLKL